jgi:acyl-CoA hydrolase
MTETTKCAKAKPDLEVDLLTQGYKSIAHRLIMSGDLNAANTLFGGKLIQWVDEAASIYVMELLRTHNVVTKKISEVLYNEPTKIGDVLEFLFRVKIVGGTSLTVECIVRTKQIDHDDTMRIILNCDLVFVKIDKLGRPVAHHYLDPSCSASSAQS